MQIYETYTKIPEQAHGCVIVIGNFDGVHKGHQEILKQAKSIARAQGKSLGVLTFEPHPRRLFRPDDPPFRITPLDLKAEKLKNSGVEFLFSIPFDWDFASLSADKFVEDVLRTGLRASHVVVGYDFCFGQLRKGTPETIKNAELTVTIIEKIEDDKKEIYSSSGIRQYLRHGKITEANRLLGWDWEIHGEVVKGDQRGRELGYPTANVMLADTVHPAYGVYATWAKLEGEEAWRASATNIGIRPMFEVPTAQVETFIFDFDAEIYGEILQVKPIRRLRGEAKFETLDELVTQIQKDCEIAREILGHEAT